MASGIKMAMTLAGPILKRGTQRLPFFSLAVITVAMMEERQPMRRQPWRIRRNQSIEMPAVAVAAAAALAFIMLSVAPTILTMNGVSAFKPEFTDEDFLYHTPDAAGIIHDYEPQENVTKPDFLYGLNQGPRVVEFYAPWCPHVS
jgi:hypothetical protein